MVGDFYAPRHFQFSSGCCEVLFCVEGHPLEAALGILGYTNDTFGLGITFQSGRRDAINSKATDRRSVSGEAFMCGGECVCWFSRTQKYVIHTFDV